MDTKKLTQQFAEQAHPDILQNFDRERLAELADEHGTPLLILDEAKIEQQYRSIAEALPGVRLHYAVKALSHPKLIEKLHALGCYFDLATNGEVNTMREVGVPPANCIHTHPIKKDAEIRHALEFGCRIFVADNIAEIDKFAPYADQAELLIRVSFRSQEAVVDLSRKFGCALDRLPALVEHARSLGIRVVGLSFHVGSQVPSPSAHVSAIESSIQVMREMDFIDWQYLDIGGGFPISYLGPVMDIADFCVPIVDALQHVPEGIRVLAEPGRYLVAPTMLEVLTVVGKAQRGARTWYYLDDGIYGAFSGQMFDHAHYPVSPLEPVDLTRPLLPSVLAGPTCDSIDVIDEDIELPELQPGDRLVARQIGAYTIASATEFNCYDKPKVIWARHLRI